MAQKSNTGIIVGVVSALVIGTTIFLIIRSARKKAQNQQLPSFPPKESQGQQELQNQQTQTQTQQTQSTNTLGGFIDSLSELFRGRASESKADPFTNFQFPIRKGQKGENVRKLQKLILGINNKALPKFGADADFGSETANALKKLIGFPFL